MLAVAPSAVLPPPKPSGLWTVPEFLVWEEVQPQDYELIHGVVHMSPSAGRWHSEIASELIFLLNQFLRKRPLGKILPELDARLDDTDYIRPDISYCSHATAARLFKDDPDGRMKGAPDLVIEILSPSSRGVDLVDKRALYEEKGVKEYWIVDPEGRTFTFLILEGATYHEATPVEGCYASSLVLPGFRLDLTAFWGRVFPG